MMKINDNALLLILESKLGIRKKEDWYNVNLRDVISFSSGRYFLKKYSNSLHAALCNLYPNIDWKPWRFGHVGKGYWNKSSNRKAYIEWIANEFGIDKEEKWYKVTVKDIKVRYGNRFLKQYGGSLQEALTELYPNVSWKSWLFGSVKSGFWDMEINRKEFLVWSAQQLGIQRDSQWYDISIDQIMKLEGAHGFLKVYSGSFRRALSVLLPGSPCCVYWTYSSRMFRTRQRLTEHLKESPAFALEVLQPTTFPPLSHARLSSQAPSRFDLRYFQRVRIGGLISCGAGALVASYKRDSLRNRNLENARHYRESGIHYKLNLGPKAVVNEGTDNRAISENSYLFRVLVELFPEFSWKPWFFHYVSSDFWSSPSNRKAFMDWLGKTLNVIEFNEWYQVKPSQVSQLGGFGLLHLYAGSIQMVLASVYPEIDWRPWLFPSVPKGYWDIASNVQQYLCWVSDQLSLVRMEDWYDVSRKQLISLKGALLLKRYRGLVCMLEKFFPTVYWDRAGFQVQTPIMEDRNRILSKDQRLLNRIARQLLPKCSLLTNFKHSGMSLELDVFIPEHSLALEYQGIQHYQWHFRNGLPHRQQYNDIEKRKLCTRLGLTLIEIPFRYEVCRNSIRSLLQWHRPDLFSKTDDDQRRTELCDHKSFHWIPTDAIECSQRSSSFTSINPNNYCAIWRVH